jgi:hypothetical protein
MLASPLNKNKFVVGSAGKVFKFDGWQQAMVVGRNFITIFSQQFQTTFFSF